MPHGTLGFEAIGDVVADDYRNVMMPPVEVMAAQGKVRLLYLVGHRFERYTTGAMWEDAEFGVRHPTHWERVALVTDVDWMRHLAGAFGWMVPGKFKTFQVSELGAAKEWTGATGPR
ncbi:MAG: STAS/SEC14 domain-containing protein [Actinomycetota bacterium]